MWRRTGTWVISGPHRRRALDVHSSLTTDSALAQLYGPQVTTSAGISVGSRRRVATTSTSRRPRGRRNALLRAGGRKVSPEHLLDTPYGSQGLADGRFRPRPNCATVTMARTPPVVPFAQPFHFVAQRFVIRAGLTRLVSSLASRLPMLGSPPMADSDAAAPSKSTTGPPGHAPASSEQISAMSSSRGRQLDERLRAGRDRTEVVERETLPSACRRRHRLAELGSRLLLCGGRVGARSEHPAIDT